MPSKFIKGACTKKTALMGASAGIIALSLVVALRAQPTGGWILSDITLAGSESCRTARISFNFPIRYVNHFPQKEGKELRIQLKPVTVGPMEEQDLQEREAFSPVDDSAPLNNVIYEGDMEGGPYLTLQFSQIAHFAVVQGTDFRSISVTFQTSGDPAASCSGTTLSAP